LAHGDKPDGSAQTARIAKKPEETLKQLSLEQLGNIEVTAISRDPQQVLKTPAAVFVITREDIRRSGATSIPEVLRLAPGVEVARIDADQRSVAKRHRQKSPQCLWYSYESVPYSEPLYSPIALNHPDCFLKGVHGNAND
jgi:hypothetical protein